MDPSTIRVLSVFSGIGGLDLGVKIAWPHVRTVCYVERDEFCQRILIERMRDGSDFALETVRNTKLPWGVVEFHLRYGTKHGKTCGQCAAWHDQMLSTPPYCVRMRNAVKVGGGTLACGRFSEKEEEKA